MKYECSSCRVAVPLKSITKMPDQVCRECYNPAPALWLAEVLAVAEMGRCGLIRKGWKFRFDSAQRRSGCCYPNRRRISLSRLLVPSLTPDEILDTIHHEIAHARRRT